MREGGGGPEAEGGGNGGSADRSPAAGGWLDAVEPPVPRSFRPWLRHPGLEGAVRTVAGSARGSRPGFGWGAALPDPGALEVAAVEALGRALSPAGREREGAFDLLAADAFVTWAAEASLDEEVPETRLRSLARRVARASAVE